MRYLPTAICLALCAQSSLAADFGLGVSAKSDDAWIYAPINFSDKFRVEPSVRFGSTESTSRPASLGGAVSQQDYEVKLESDSLEIGVGVFALTKITDSTRIYYGARLSYVDSERKSAEPLPFGGAPYRIKTSLDGYRFGPAIGFEYLFGKHLSIGGEANYTYLDVDGETEYSVGGSLNARTYENVEQKGSGTGTQLIIRYQF